MGPQLSGHWAQDRQTSAAAYRLGRERLDGWTGGARTRLRRFNLGGGVGACSGGWIGPQRKRGCFRLFPEFHGGHGTRACLPGLTCSRCRGARRSCCYQVHFIARAAGGDWIGTGGREPFIFMRRRLFDDERQVSKKKAWPRSVSG